MTKNFFHLIELFSLSFFLDNKKYSVTLLNSMRWQHFLTMKRRKFFFLSLSAIRVQFNFSANKMVLEAGSSSFMWSSKWKKKKLSHFFKCLPWLRRSILSAMIWWAPVRCAMLTIMIMVMLESLKRFELCLTFYDSMKFTHFYIHLIPWRKQQNELLMRKVFHHRIYFFLSLHLLIVFTSPTTSLS